MDCHITRGAQLSWAGYGSGPLHSGLGSSSHHICSPPTFSKRYSPTSETPTQSADVCRYFIPGEYCETFNTYNRLRIKLTCLLILLLDPESNLKLPFGKLKAISVSLSTLHDPDPIRLYILYQLPQAFPQSVPSVCRGLHHTAGNVPIAPQ